MSTPTADTAASFAHLPWATALLSAPNTTHRIPSSRTPRGHGEDSLFSQTLHTPTTIHSCLTTFPTPSSPSAKVNEVTTLMLVGSALGGHISIMHGGIVASILDEGMGILQSVNHENAHLQKVARGEAKGNVPEFGIGSFTLELKVRYLRPVRIPGGLSVRAEYVRVEGRKEWLRAEVRQFNGGGEEGKEGEVLCAVGEGFFVTPRGSKI